MPSEQVDGGAVREIERLTNAASSQVHEGNVRRFATTQLHPLTEKEPEPATIALSTLQSFADFVKGQADDYAADRGYFVHVESPAAVRLCTGVFGDFNQRVDVARASAIVPAFAFGRYIEQSEFCTALLAMFEPTEDREKVAALVSNIKWDQGVQSTDDGRSQQVVARAGVSTVRATFTPEIVKLRPYRTFSEIDPQPESPFILRVRGSAEKPGECMLVECDGGRWRLDAVKRVKEWLRVELPDVQIYG